MIGISVIICCYNSSKRIGTTLDHLVVQRTEGLFNFEIILVDNNSSDNTFEEVKDYFRLKKEMVDFSILKEPKPGRSNALKLGIKSSKYDFLVMCDDDNWLEDDYLSITYRYLLNNHDIALIGGEGSARFSSAKPGWFDQYYHGYAVGRQSEQNTYLQTIYGAGMGARKSVVEQCFAIPFFLTGRKGSKLTSGEDTELCYRVGLMKFKIFYTSELKFQHDLSAERLSWNYLKRLHNGLSEPDFILDLYRDVLANRSFKKWSWLKKGMYFLCITLKYGIIYALKGKLFKEGNAESIRISGWLINSKNYFSYNFDTYRIYNQIKMFANHD